MKVAILETVKATAGFELAFDRIIIEALQRAGHNAVLFIPQDTQFDQDFSIPTVYLDGGRIVSYEGAGRLKKLYLSLQRENRRVKWFNSAVEKAKTEQVDVILLTTATYRYLRSLKKSKMKDADIPVCFIFLGVNPTEKPKFIKKAQACLPYANIKLRVTTLRDDFAAARPANVKLIAPPVMVPDTCQQETKESETLKIGFFGHYRKGEKNLDWILSAIEKANFKRSVKFILQTVPTTEQDREEVQVLIEKYQQDNRVSFITNKLLGDNWYKAVQNVDVVFLPYTAERYLYNWSAIYFTAIGCHKPVLVTKILNPEVMASFHIGEFIDMQDFTSFFSQLEDFVNQYAAKKVQYKSELKKANECYSKKQFIENLLK